jgi:hypothetical protein
MEDKKRFEEETYEERKARLAAERKKANEEVLKSYKIKKKEKKK